ncbi:Protein of unknown function [Propionibacterium freudenreichii subsp. freudenreichii]|uniref:Uncharacterized protein n=1 Tax=Propionibacterium freudenreichii subsp. freudenreichii TaxID=66712 RepID=A0A0B7NZT8_PROFF|nr:Protein of unknown function [Propionibacterium freudenreichii subsp. freudenreichii]
MSARSKLDTPHDLILPLCHSRCISSTVCSSGTSPRQCNRYRSA